MSVKKLLRNLENVFAASAFAEAGEFETARQIAKGDEVDGTTSPKDIKHGKHEHHESVETPYPSKA